MDIATIQNECELKMDAALTALDEVLQGIRSNRAHPSLLSHIKVDAYGAATALGHLASINVEDARSLVVTPYDRALLAAVEKAIAQSETGLMASNQGDHLRVPMPLLTQERRVELVKLVKQECEKVRVSLRNIRRSCMQKIEDAQKDKVISQDDARRFEQVVQKITDQKVKVVEAKLQSKEKDICG